MQVDVFKELRAKKPVPTRMGQPSDSRANSQTSAVPHSWNPALQSEVPQPSIFVTADDRQLLLALLLHCADISNSAKPWTIAEKYTYLLALFSPVLQPRTHPSHAFALNKLLLCPHASRTDALAYASFLIAPHGNLLWGFSVYCLHCVCSS